jgi:survival of motor neuron protein-interacting protein 1
LKLLFYHIEWLEGSTVTSKQATWMWALLTRLDKVMTSDQLSVLRDVSRKFISLRQGYQDPLDPSVIYLNILITIIAKHFGQADLL